MAADSGIDIDYVANLARLELTPAERERFAGQLGNILGYIERIRAVDVEGVEPTAHAFPVENVLDDDEPGPLLTPAAVLANAPQQRQGQFVVPKVVEEA